MTVDAAAGRPGHHLVSRGYQQNFASETRRVVLFATTSGEILDSERAIRSNWRRAGFNDFEREPGVFDSSLEIEFSRIERRVLDQIRRISPTNCGPEMRHAVAELFAMHLVRSEAFLSMQAEVTAQFRHDDLPRIAGAPDLATVFERQYGRPPAEGEIEQIARRGFDWLVDSRQNLATSMVRQYNQLGERLNGYFMQVLWSREPLPGFILADVPTVHADVRSHRYGFRDRLALGDSNLIVGPLTRRVAVGFTARRLPHVELRTRKQVDLLNAIFWRAAVAEVVCHPDDSHPTSQLGRRLDRLPPSHLNLG